MQFEFEFEFDSVKVVPYSFTLALLLRTKASVTFVRSEENCFSIFYDVNIIMKSKTNSEFSPFSPGEIP